MLIVGTLSAEVVKRDWFYVIAGCLLIMANLQFVRGPQSAVRGSLSRGNCQAVLLKAGEAMGQKLAFRQW